MGNSKVIFGNETLIDLTGDTVTPDTLLAGTTAHNRSGEQIVGTATVPDTLDDLTDVEFTSPADGDLLQYDATEQKWVNSAVIPQKVAGLQETGCINYYKVTTQSQVKSGLTFTVADNGIIGISGAISESGQLDLNNSSDNSVNLPLGVPLKFIAIGFAGSNDYLFATLNATVNGSLQRLAKDYNGNGAIFTLDPNKTYSNFYVRFAYYTQYGSIPSGAKLFPMITPDLSATYADYQPYSMTNRELTEAVDDKKKSGIGTYTDISSYNSNTNMFTAPSDGYIVALSGGGMTSGTMEFVIVGSNGVGLVTRLFSIAQQYTGDPFFVRAGMKAYVKQLASGAMFRFYPLI